MSKAGKGSQFEREICKRLSLWWTQGKKARDDVFWRSSQSGGRATFRAQKGKKTYGHYGDIAAVDPIGEPLLRAFTIELKTGKSHGEVIDLIDWNCVLGPCGFEKTLLQAYTAHLQAGSLGWMVISRRLCKVPVIYATMRVLRDLAWDRTALLCTPCAVFKIILDEKPVSFIAMTFSNFLNRVSPDEIRDFVRRNP